jgi:predicted porin
VEFTGFVDFYYLYNFTAQNPTFRAFDVTHNSFSLNLAELALEKKPSEDDRAGYRLDFNYGPTATVVNGGGSFENIQQAYLSYLAPVGKGLQFDFGKFGTPIGAEVAETRDNWNYSRSLLYNFAEPLHHMGIRLSYPVSDQVGLSLFLVNGWNNPADNNTGKTGGASLSLKPSDSLSIVATFLGGPEQAGNNDNLRTALDAVLTYTITPQLTFMGNYDWVHEKDQAGTGTGTQALQGGAAYLKIQVNDMFAISPRFEYLSDSDGVAFTPGTGQKVKDGTLTLDIKHSDGVRLLIEYRRDFSDKDSWLKKDLVTPVNHQDTVAFGLVYAFGM